MTIFLGLDQCERDLCELTIKRCFVFAAVKLTAEEPTATWSFDEEDDDEDFLMHTLFLRHVSC